VLRGPCYVALASLLARAARPDGIILVAEPKRSLTARDVTDVLDVPVVVTWMPALMSPARSMLVFWSRVFIDFANSRLSARSRLIPTRVFSDPSTARSRQRRTPLSKFDTDLPFAQSANSGRFVARVTAHTAGLLTRR
jgi:hypothetical protein